MTAVNLKTLLKKANKDNYAVAGLVVIAWEDALAFTEAADDTGIPIILQAGPSCRAFTPISILGKMFRYLAEQTTTPICCHLDHGFSYDECKAGIDNGFTSVMFDGSKLSLKENIKVTSKIVKKAHMAKVSVEGEIGFVGYANSKSSEGTLTDEAISFAKESLITWIKLRCSSTNCIVSDNFAWGALYHFVFTFVKDEIISSVTNEVINHFSNIQIEYHNGYQEIKDKLEKCGFNVHVSKPISSNVLGNLVSRFSNKPISRKKIGYVGFVYAEKRGNNWLA